MFGWGGPGKPNFFGGISGDFCRGIPGRPKSLKKKIVFNSRPLYSAIRNKNRLSQITNILE